jgi:hypothetical protein
MSDPVTPAKRNALAIVLGFWLVIALIGFAFLAHFSITLLKNNYRLQLQIAQSKSSVPKAPPMPVTLSFGATAAGNGLALWLHNSSTNFLSVRVTFTDRTLQQAMTYQHINLSPLATEQVGNRNGSPRNWAIAPDDRIEIQNTNYDSIVRIVTVLDCMP